MDPFRIRDFVPDFAAREADYRAASDATRRALPSRLDLAYGSGERERLDLFLPPILKAPAPVHVFIHGGYWRAGVKEDHAFVADAITSAGAIAAILEYELVPRVRIADQVGEVRRALAWLVANAASFGGDAERLSASGHSAGAMLCFFLAAHGNREPGPISPPLRCVLLASGIYDLAPIAASFLQPELTLTADEIGAWSPLSATPAATTRFILAVGERETPPFHEQRRRLAQKLGSDGVTVESHTVPGLDHMSMVREMGRPGTSAAALLARTIALD